MKKGKWICRYVLLGLLFAGCLAWTIYCGVAVAQLNARINSLEFLDLAVQVSPEAPALLSRLDTFQGYLTTGIWLTILSALAIGLMAAWQVLEPKFQAKKQHKKAEPAPKPVPKPAPKAEPEPAPMVIPVAKPQPAPRAGGFCTNCGKQFEMVPLFCDQCGAKIEVEE